MRIPNGENSDFDRRHASALSRTKSYGLGKLCELYGIELETHHRALCDARATGHLLNLMNLKREGCAPDRAEEAA